MRLEELKFDIENRLQNELPMDGLNKTDFMIFIKDNKIQITSMEKTICQVEDINNKWSIITSVNGNIEDEEWGSIAYEIIPIYISFFCKSCIKFGNMTDEQLTE